MEIIVLIGSGTHVMGREHFLVHGRQELPIIVFGESNLNPCRAEEFLPNLEQGLKEIRPNNNEFLIEKLKLFNEDDFIFLLEQSTDQHDFYCLEMNIGDQNDYHLIKTNRCCSRGPPRAKNYNYILCPFLFLFLSLKTKGVIEQQTSLNNQ